ncbi:unnamed protein product [Rhizophagus irregularis]|nr:unnamed protein product [Rhizophagus irregularis]
MSFSLQAFKLSTSFRFLGVWFNLQGSPNFVLSQLKDIYSNFVASVRFKKLSPSQLAYLHSSVIIPKVQFRSQVLYLSESQIMRIAKGYYSLQRSKYANWVLITLRTLQGTLKWPSSLDSINDFSLWTSKRRSTSHNWLFQTIKLIRSIGLQFDFPTNTFLDLMPNESCPLVSISPFLANLETHSWLKSALWCLSQLLDPFRRFQYSWMDLRKMGLVANTGCIPFWFKEISSIPDLPSLLLSPRPNSTNSLIFGRAFYTFDDSSGNRVIYFSHWIPASHDRMVLTPCPGCSLHCLEDNEGLLALKSVGGKLIHRFCLMILPSYRCLNLYQMTSHIDSSQQYINLKLSPFILCSYFRFLLGLSEIYIPEPFLVSEISPPMQSDDSPAQIPLDPTHRLFPAFALSSGTHFHIVGTVHEGDLSTSHLNCAWVQTLDDYILKSGVFSCPVVSPYKDVTELTFIIYVLNSLPPESAVDFSSLLQLHLSYHNWMNASSIKRVRLKNNVLWSCVSELIRSKHISCGFNGLIQNAPIPQQ